MSNSNKEEFNKQDTAEGKVNVKIVTMDVKIFGKYAVFKETNVSYGGRKHKAIQ